MAQIEIITSVDAFERLKTEWDLLLSDSSTDSVFMTWEWLYGWWEVYARGNRLSILVVRDEKNHILGIAPFYIKIGRSYGIPLKTLHLIGSSEVCSEYLDIIARTDAVDTVIAKLMKYISCNFTDCDLFDFKDLPDESLLEEVLNAIKSQEPLTLYTEVKTTNPYILLPQNKNDFLMTLSSKRRNEVKRRDKRLKEAHEYTVTLIQGDEEIKEAFDNFVTLHQKLWNSRGLPGVFKREDYLDFHRRTAQRFNKQGWLKIYLLSIDNSPIAALYGFLFKGKFYYYQSGSDPAWSKWGVGFVLVNHSIQDQILSGTTIYDFLRGDMAYKSQLTKESRHTKEIIAIKDSYKAGLYIALRTASRRYRELLKKALPGSLVSCIRKIKDNARLR
jgi:CelD/BcsL family acetyltransferase involved in cellulose biosynthesis